MAAITSTKTGDFNDGSTWVGGVVPGSNDTATVATGHTVTISTNINCISLNKAGTGKFTSSTNGITITAAINGGSNSGTCFEYTASAPNIINIVGNVTGGTGGAGTCFAIDNTSSGTINITGPISGSAAGSNNYAIRNNSSGSVNATGNVTGGNSTGAGNHAIWNTGGGTVNVTGVITGGSNTGAAVGVFNNSSGVISITGNVNAANFAGISNSTSGTLQITGDCTASNAANCVVSSNAGSPITISGSLISSQNGYLAVQAPRLLVSPIPLNAKTRYALSGSGTFVDMFTADNNLGQANPTDVRSGVSYASGTLTGKMLIPARGAIASGVAYGPTMPFTAARSGTTATATLAYSYPYQVGDVITVTDASNHEWNMDYTIASVVSGDSVTFEVPSTHSSTAGTGANMQTKGTSTLDVSAVAAAVWGAATSSLTAAGSIGERLKNSATVATTGEQLATALTAP